MAIPWWVWNPICCLCFILIWNSYQTTSNKKLVYCLRGLGIITLLALAYTYRGGSNGQIQYFSPQWWGILGIIGWSYFVSALVVVFSRGNRYVLIIGWFFFCLLGMLNMVDLIPRDGFLSFIPNIIGRGSHVALTMGGVLTGVTFQYYRKRQDDRKMNIVFFVAVLALATLAVITRTYWGISKLAATPAWLFICSAITLFAFIVIHWVADVKGKASWFKIVKPAGTDTLLCYLVPYLLYGFFSLVDFRFPQEVLTGTIGLIKSVSLAFLCVFITDALNKVGVKLKL